MSNSRNQILVRELGKVGGIAGQGGNLGAANGEYGLIKQYSAEKAVGRFREELLMASWMFG